MQLAEIQSSKQISMTSLQIAELVNSRHDKVKQSIERLATSTDKKRAVIALPPMGIVVNTANNRTYETEVYIFSGEQGKRDTYIVVAQLSPEFTGALVDRWQELENKDLSKLEILQMALQSEQERIALENKVEQLQPKADAYEILSGANGSVSIRVASGELKVPEKKFIQWLLDNDWAYREGNRTDGKLLPHAHRKEQGYLELVSVVTYNTGEAVARSQTKVTQKGLTRLAQIFSKNRALLTHKISSNEVSA